MTDFQPSRQQSDLADVVEMLLDKGVVINADIAVSIADTQLLGIQVRAAIASFDTAARYGLEFPEGTDMERLAEAIDEPELAARERRRKVAVAPTRGVNVSPEPGEDDGDDDEGDRGTKRFAARPDPEQPIDDGIDIGGSEEQAERAEAEPVGGDGGDGGDADDEDDSSGTGDSNDAESESADEEATAATAETEGNGDGD